MTSAIDLLLTASEPDPNSGLIVPPTLALVENERPEPDDIDITSAVINGNPIDQEIPGSIDDGTLTRTMDGASTLELITEDPQRRLINTDMFSRFAAQKDVFLTLDGRDWALVKISKQADSFTIDFENRAVNELRKYTQPKKAYRDSVTRAEFVLSLVREVKGYHIGFYSPELHKQQPIAKKTQKQTRSTRNKLRHRGIKGHITVKHQRATGEQISLINRVLDVGSSLNAPYPVMVAAIETITQESDVHNDVGHGGVDVGLFNQNRHMGWPASRDVEKDSKAFFDKAIVAYRQNPRLKASDIAQAVQRSGAGAHYYEQWKDEAVATLKAYGAHGGAGSITLTRYQRFAFRRGTTSGKREDSWTTIKRLAEEVNWRAFMVDDTLYFVDDQTLLDSAPRMTINELETPGIQNIDYDLDNGKKVESATIYCRANRWTAPPGTVVELVDMGDPVGGRWIVQENTRPIFSKDAEITLRREQKSKLEPAPSATTVTLKGSSGIAGVDKAYKKAQEIGKKKWAYKWGGGHGSFAGPYDCSGAVSAVLHEAGWLKSPETTVGLANWGHAGEGRYMTVWVHNGGPGGGHTFIVFNMPGKGKQHWGTGNWGKSWDGAGFNPTMHPTAGFSPRHWPGT